LFEGAAQFSRRLLQRHDERGTVITVDGKAYRRVGRHEGTYYTKAGPVTVGDRSIVGPEQAGVESVAWASSESVG